MLAVVSLVAMASWLPRVSGAGMGSGSRSGSGSGNEMAHRFRSGSRAALRALTGRSTAKQGVDGSMILEMSHKMHGISWSGEPLFDYVGSLCGSSRTSSAFLDKGMYQSVVIEPTLDEPNSIISGCMAKCRGVATNPEEQMQCSGIQVGTNGTCHLQFMNIGDGLHTEDEVFTQPYGCWKRIENTPAYKQEGYTYLGGGGCISTYDKTYKARTSVYNGPWSPMLMISYCAKICNKNDQCAGFQASGVCTVFLGSISDSPGFAEESTLSEPYGCYKKGELTVQNAMAVERSPANIRNPILPPLLSDVQSRASGWPPLPPMGAAPATTLAGPAGPTGAGTAGLVGAVAGGEVAAAGATGGTPAGGAAAGGAAAGGAATGGPAVGGADASGAAASGPTAAVAGSSLNGEPASLPGLVTASATPPGSAPGARPFAPSGPISGAPSGPISGAPSGPISGAPSGARPGVASGGAMSGVASGAAVAGVASGALTGVAPGAVAGVAPGAMSSGASTALPATVAGPTSGTVPSAVQGAVASAVAAAVPGALPGAAVAAVPGALPGAAVAAVPGALPSAVPGGIPGAVAGAVPGSIPGVVAGGISGAGALPGVAARTSLPAEPGAVGLASSNVAGQPAAAISPPAFSATLSSPVGAALLPTPAGVGSVAASGLVGSGLAPGGSTLQAEPSQAGASMPPGLGQVDIGAAVAKPRDPSNTITPTDAASTTDEYTLSNNSSVPKTEFLIAAEVKAADSSSDDARKQAIPKAALKTAVTSLSSPPTRPSKLPGGTLPLALPSSPNPPAVGRLSLSAIPAKSAPVAAVAARRKAKSFLPLAKSVASLASPANVVNSPRRLKQAMALPNP